MFCQNCSTLNNKNSDFCMNCGCKLNKDDFENKNIQESNKSEKFFVNKKMVVGIFGILIFGLTVCLVFKIQNNKAYGYSSGEESVTYSYTKDNIPKFIDGTYSDVKAHGYDEALKSLKDIKNLNINDPLKEFIIDDVLLNEGISYYKYQQVYKNIPVYNQKIVIMVDKNDNILGFSGYYIPNINIDIIPKKSRKDIDVKINELLGEDTKILESGLSILADNDDQSLVYVVNAYSSSDGGTFIVDANTGEVLQKIDVFVGARGNPYSYTGMGMDFKTFTINLEPHNNLLGDKNRYDFYDSYRNIAVTDYRNIGQIFSIVASAVPGVTPIEVGITDGKIDETMYLNPEFIKEAITAMANYEKIYDFYKNVLGRDSYNGKGGKIIVNLGVGEETFSNKDLNNAFWCSLTNQMYIGDWKGKSFSASLDVLAHEFTHGVIQNTANFANRVKKEDRNKAFEAGALNEAYADIIGSLIEGKNWTMAEDNETLRTAVNPESYKNPSIKGGEYYYPDYFIKKSGSLEQFLKDNNFANVTDYDNGGVHTNLTVVSHAAYLMYEDKAFSNREEMAKIWYNSLFMLTPYSTFEDCALAVIKSANIYGLSSDAIYKITKAFIDTKMLDNNNCVVKGTVSSGNELLKNASIEIYSYSDDSLVTSVNTDSYGMYEVSLPAGTYKIKVTKKNFSEYNSVFSVKGDTTLNIELASNKKKSGSKNYCKGNDCVNFTIYYMDLETRVEKHDTYQYDKGTKMDANLILKAFDGFDEKMTTDGKSFKMSIGGIEFGFSFYYRGTNTKFDFNKSLNSDVEIEMKFSSELSNIFNILK